MRARSGKIISVPLVRVRFASAEVTGMAFGANLRVNWVDHRGIWWACGCAGQELMHGGVPLVTH